MDMVFSHGVAYQNNANLQGMLDNIVDIVSNPKMEIAVSREDQPLGRMGIYCTGKVLKMWPFDCQSYTDKDGHRRSIMKGECTLVEWNKSTVTCEAFLTDISIESVWFKKSFLRTLSKEDVELICSTLDTLGVSFETAPEYYPVWN